MNISCLAEFTPLLAFARKQRGQFALIIYVVPKFQDSLNYVLIDDHFSWSRRYHRNSSSLPSQRILIEKIRNLNGPFFSDVNARMLGLFGLAPRRDCLVSPPANETGTRLCGSYPLRCVSEDGYYPLRCPVEPGLSSPTDSFCICL